MARETADPVPGRGPTLRDGRYAIVSRIDAGGMSAVFRVWDHKLKVARAMKVLLPEYARNAKIRQRFESEARTMARLEHRNLVRIYDVGIQAELPYLVMELVTGGSLQRWIETRGAMPPRLALEATLQLTAGLVAVHAAGVVHRDIKPHNVLIAAPGICKLTDFGIAHLGEGSSTQTGTTLGTQGYMAPEQRADAKSVDARADLYGAGATLWAMLTGQPAHDVFLAVERNGLRQVPPWLHEVVRKTVAYAREDRYPDAVSLQAALKAALASAPPAGSVSQLLVAESASTEPSDLDTDEIVELLTRSADQRTTPDPAPTPTPMPASMSSTSATALPYYMPTVGKSRRSMSQPSTDEEPDWIARDEPAGNRREEQVIGADVPVRPEEPEPQETQKSTPEPAVQSPNRSTPPGLFVEPPDTASPPPPPPSQEQPPAPPPPTEVEPESSGLLVWLLAPIAGLLLGALLLVLLAGGIVSMASRSVTAAEHVASDNREQVYRALEDEGGAVQLFKQAGIPTQDLEATYLEFHDAKGEPDRRTAARAYLALLEVESERWLGPDAATPAQTEAAHAVRRIRARDQAWREAEAAWGAAGSGLAGRVAVALGLARPPPTER